MIEIAEQLTIPLDSREHQRGHQELSIEVRICWDHYTGMWAEPVSYALTDEQGTPGTTQMHSANTPPPLWPLCEMIVRGEFSQDALDIMKLEHPAFQEARDMDYAEAEAERREYREMVL